MPFDCLPTETDAFVSLDQPSLRGLAYALRHRETWPAEFEWDYGLCENCAIGLSAALWKEVICVPRQSYCQRAFSLDPDFAEYIFFGLTHRNYKSRQAITPEHVADAIDAYLATG